MNMRRATRYRDMFSATRVLCVICVATVGGVLIAYLSGGTGHTVRQAALVIACFVVAGMLVRADELAERDEGDE